MTFSELESRSVSLRNYVGLQWQNNIYIAITGTLLMVLQNQSMYFQI